LRRFRGKFSLRQRCRRPRLAQSDPKGAGEARALFGSQERADDPALAARYERQVCAQELGIVAVSPTAAYDVGALVLGYLRSVGTMAGLAAGVGTRGSVNFVPSSLEAEYGSRTPVGWAVYIRLRPAGGGH